MGTREVYEEKLRRGNLDYDPTMNPGLGSARCPRCLSLLNPNSEKGEWTITPVLHDAAAVAGSGIGGLLSAVHAFNTGYALPKFAQLTVTSYYASSSASHYGISMLTRRIEEAHLSRTQQEEVK
ncbi:hypothetical protein CARUB_v10025684mg [Capsella rubella]|uniref:Uncharacterized protein n=1 Tax=Capsella rubella TaxID=81985 RepID=R0G273_9BRAS|nr:hypothetical protein CARUB_v10025684mg [Capsella rubella]